MNRSSVFRLSFYLLLFTLFILPLPIGSNRPWAWSLFEILIAVTSLLTALTVRPNTAIAQIKYIFPILVPLALLQVWTVFQILPLTASAITNDAAQSEIALIKGISYCLFIVSCSCHLTDKQKVTHFCYTVVAAVAMQALYAVYLQYSAESHSPVFGMRLGERATGSFVYQNHLANYLLIGASLSIGFLISHLTRRSKSANFKRQMMSVFDALLSSKWLIRVSIICIVVALILTRSRMGNAAFFVSLVITSLLALWQMKRPPRVLKWLVLSFIVLDIAIVGALFGIEKVKERVDSTSFQSETRDDVVALSIPLIQEKWLTGTGAGTFYTAFPQVHHYTIHGLYDHAHNEYIQFAVEYGVIPTVMLGLMILYCFYQAIIALRERRDSFYQGLAFGCIMAIIGMLMHIAVDFPLQAPATTVNFLAVLILAILCNKQRGEKKVTF